MDVQKPLLPAYNYVQRGMSNNQLVPFSNQQAAEIIQQRAQQRRAEAQDRRKMYSLLDPILNIEGNKRVQRQFGLSGYGPLSYVAGSLLGTGELVINNTLKYFTDPGEAVMNNLRLLGDTADQVFGAAAIKSSMIANQEGRDPFQEIMKAYGLGDDGRTMYDASTILDNEGIEAGWVGDLAGEILLDPSTYFTMGASGALKSSLKTVGTKGTQLVDDLALDFIKKSGRFRTDEAGKLVNIFGDKHTKGLSNRLLKAFVTEDKEDFMQVVKKYYPINEKLGTGEMPRKIWADELWEKTLGTGEFSNKLSKKYKVMKTLDEFDVNLAKTTLTPTLPYVFYKYIAKPGLPRVFGKRADKIMTNHLDARVKTYEDIESSFARQVIEKEDIVDIKSRMDNYIKQFADDKFTDGEKLLKFEEYNELFQKYEVLVRRSSTRENVQSYYQLFSLLEMGAKHEKIRTPFQLKEDLKRMQELLDSDEHLRYLFVNHYSTGSVMEEVNKRLKSTLTDIEDEMVALRIKTQGTTDESEIDELLEQLGKLQDDYDMIADDGILRYYDEQLGKMEARLTAQKELSDAQLNVPSNDIQKQIDDLTKTADNANTPKAVKEDAKRRIAALERLKKRTGHRAAVDFDGVELRRVELEKRLGNISDNIHAVENLEKRLKSLEDELKAIQKNPEGTISPSKRMAKLRSEIDETNQAMKLEYRNMDELTAERDQLLKELERYNLVSTFKFNKTARSTGKKVVHNFVTPKNVTEHHKILKQQYNETKRLLTLFNGTDYTRKHTQHDYVKAHTKELRYIEDALTDQQKIIVKAIEKVFFDLDNDAITAEHASVILEDLASRNEKLVDLFKSLDAYKVAPSTAISYRTINSLNKLLTGSRVTKEALDEQFKEYKFVRARLTDPNAYGYGKDLSDFRQQISDYSAAYKELEIEKEETIKELHEAHLKIDDQVNKLQEEYQRQLSHYDDVRVNLGEDQYQINVQNLQDELHLNVGVLENEKRRIQNPNFIRKETEKIEKEFAEHYKKVDETYRDVHSMIKNQEDVSSDYKRLQKEIDDLKKKQDAHDASVEVISERLAKNQLEVQNIEEFLDRNAKYMRTKSSVNRIMNSIQIKIDELALQKQEILNDIEDLKYSREVMYSALQRSTKLAQEIKKLQLEFKQYDAVRKKGKFKDDYLNDIEVLQKQINRDTILKESFKYKKEALDQEIPELIKNLEIKQRLAKRVHFGSEIPGFNKNMSMERRLFWIDRISKYLQNNQLYLNQFLILDYLDESLGKISFTMPENANFSLDDVEGLRHIINNIKLNFQRYHVYNNGGKRQLDKLRKEAQEAGKDFEIWSNTQLQREFDILAYNLQKSQKMLQHVQRTQLSAAMEDILRSVRSNSKEIRDMLERLLGTETIKNRSEALMHVYRSLYAYLDTLIKSDLGDLFKMAKELEVQNPAEAAEAIKKGADKLVHLTKVMAPFESMNDNFISYTIEYLNGLYLGIMSGEINPLDLRKSGYFGAVSSEFDLYRTMDEIQKDDLGIVEELQIIQAAIANQYAIKAGEVKHEIIEESLDYYTKASKNELNIFKHITEDSGYFTNKLFHDEIFKKSSHPVIYNDNRPKITTHDEVSMTLDTKKEAAEEVRKLRKHGHRAKLQQTEDGKWDVIRREYLKEELDLTSKDTRFAVLDVESTGLNIHDQIWQVAVVVIDGTGEEITKVNKTIKLEDGVTLPNSVSNLTRKTMDDIQAEGQPLDEVLSYVKHVIGDSIIVAQNASFDYNMLKSAFRKHYKDPNLKMDNPVIDTWGMAMSYGPELDRHRLDDISEALGVKVDRTGRHDAMEDTKLTVEVFKELIKRSGKKTLKELNDVNPVTKSFDKFVDSQKENPIKAFNDFIDDFSKGMRADVNYRQTTKKIKDAYIKDTETIPTAEFDSDGFTIDGTRKETTIRTKSEVGYNYETAYKQIRANANATQTEFFASLPYDEQFIMKRLMNLEIDIKDEKSLGDAYAELEEILNDIKRIRDNETNFKISEPTTRTVTNWVKAQKLKTNKQRRDAVKEGLTIKRFSDGYYRMTPVQETITEKASTGSARIDKAEELVSALYDAVDGTIKQATDRGVAWREALGKKTPIGYAQYNTYYAKLLILSQVKSSPHLRMLHDMLHDRNTSQMGTEAKDLARIMKIAKQNGAEELHEMTRLIDDIYEYTDFIGGLMDEVAREEVYLMFDLMDDLDRIMTSHKPVDEKELTDLIHGKFLEYTSFDYRKKQGLSKKNRLLDPKIASRIETQMRYMFREGKPLLFDPSATISNKFQDLFKKNILDTMRVVFYPQKTVDINTKSVTLTNVAQYRAYAEFFEFALDDIRRPLREITSKNKELELNPININDFRFVTNSREGELIEQNSKYTIKGSDALREDRKKKKVINSFLGDQYKEPKKVNGLNGEEDRVLPAVYSVNTRVYSMLKVLAKTLGIDPEDLASMGRRFTENTYSKYLYSEMYDQMRNSLIKQPTRPKSEKYDKIKELLNQLETSRRTGERYDDTLLRISKGTEVEETVQEIIDSRQFLQFVDPKDIDSIDRYIYRRYHGQATHKEIDDMIEEFKTIEELQYFKDPDEVLRRLKATYVEALYRLRPDLMATLEFHNQKAAVPMHDYLNIFKYSQSFRNVRSHFEKPEELLNWYQSQSDMITIAFSKGKMQRVQLNNVEDIARLDTLGEQTAIEFMTKDTYNRLAKRHQRVLMHPKAKMLHDLLVNAIKMPVFLTANFLFGNTVEGIMKNSIEGNNPLEAMNDTVNSAKHMFKWHSAYMEASLKYGDELYREFGPATQYRWVDWWLDKNPDRYNAEEIEMIRFTNNFMLTDASQGEFQNFVKNAELGIIGTGTGDRKMRQLGEEFTPKMHTYLDPDEYHWVKEAKEQAKGKKSFDSYIDKLLYNKYTAKMLNISAMQESIFRMGLYINTLRHGGAFDEAVESVRKTFFSLSNKPQSELYAEFAIPFVGFPLRNYMYFMEAMENPHMQEFAVDIMFNAWGDLEEDENDYFKYMFSRGSLPVSGGQLMDAGLTFMDALSLPGTAPQSAQRRLNPLAKNVIAGVEQMNGNSDASYILPLGQNVSGLAHSIQSMQSGNYQADKGLPSLFNRYYQNQWYNNRQYSPNRYYQHNFYNSMYTRGGHSRLKMRAMPANMSNLNYKVNDIMWLYR